MSARRIYTASDFGRGLHAAIQKDDPEAMRQLHVHGIHANHCDGYEVLAWPCPAAASVLERLLGGDS